MYEYDKQKFADYGHDKGKTWQHVNEIMKRKRKARSSIKKIRNKEGEDISDLEGIANCLNEHFSSVGKNMAEKHDKNENLKNPIDYITDRVEENITLCDTSCSEILDIILAQDDKTACGYDEINNKIIKKTSTVAAPFL